MFEHDDKIYGFNDLLNIFVKTKYGFIKKKQKNYKINCCFKNMKIKNIKFIFHQLK